MLDRQGLKGSRIHTTEHSVLGEGSRIVTEPSDWLELDEVQSLHAESNLPMLASRTGWRTRTTSELDINMYGRLTRARVGYGLAVEHEQSKRQGER